MRSLDILAAILLVVGGLNWGLVGLMDFDLVATIFGEMSVLSRVVYGLVGLSALYQALQWKAIQRRWGLAAAAAAALMLFTATPAVAQSSNGTHGSDIVETAAAAGSFKTLVAAVQAAGLVETLKGSGPFTVFAPTDEAFAKLPAGTVEELLKPENRDRLRAILTYHVVPGRVPAAKVAGMRSASTVQGQSLDIRVRDGVPMVDNARILKTDIIASNGIIHVIDSVVLPDEG